MTQPTAVMIAPTLEAPEKQVMTSTKDMTHLPYVNLHMLKVLL